MKSIQESWYKGKPASSKKFTETTYGNEGTERIKFSQTGKGQDEVTGKPEKKTVPPGKLSQKFALAFSFERCPGETLREMA